MGRKRRIHLPETIVHVSQCCLNREALIKERHDKDRYIHILREKATLLDYTLINYSIRDNNIGLILKTPERIKDHTLSAFMHRLNTSFGKQFNKRHQREGTVWNSRFNDIWAPECSAERLLKLIWFVETNSIYRNMVVPVSPELWEWCSAYWAFQVKGDPAGAALLVVLAGLLQGSGLENDPLWFLKQLLDPARKEWGIEIRKKGSLWYPSETPPVIVEKVEASLRAPPRPLSWVMLVETHACTLAHWLTPASVGTY